MARYVCVRVHSVKFLNSYPGCPRDNVFVLQILYKTHFTISLITIDRVERDEEENRISILKGEKGTNI